MTPSPSPTLPSSILNRAIVLDDTDPSITYTGSGWTQENGDAQAVFAGFWTPYLHTLHQTLVDGSVALEFNGTAIEVWGTGFGHAQDQPSALPDPGVECFIDDVRIDSEFRLKVKTSEYTERTLCSKIGLPDGLHKLRIDIRIPPDIGPIFYFIDRILYLPSASMPLDGKIIQVNNDDPGVWLDSRWRLNLPDANSNITSQPGATAEIDFYGTSISWVGYLPSRFQFPPHTTRVEGTWSIDQGEVVQFTAEMTLNEDRALFPNVVYFTTPDIEAGPHRLTVTLLGPNTTTDMSLDCLYVHNGTLTSDKNGNITGTSSPTSTLTPNHTLGSTPNISHPKNGKHLIGPILGGVLGGLALLVLIISLLRWRRRRAQQDADIIAPRSHPLVPTEGISRFIQSKQGASHSEPVTPPVAVALPRAPRKQPPNAPPLATTPHISGTVHASGKHRGRPPAAAVEAPLPLVGSVDVSLHVVDEPDVNGNTGPRPANGDVPVHQGNRVQEVPPHYTEQ